MDEIQIDKVGTRIFMVQKQSGNVVFPVEPVLCKVSLIDGSKVLQVQSLLTVWNFLNVTISVQFHMEEEEGKGLYTQAVVIGKNCHHIGTYLSQNLGAAILFLWDSDTVDL